MPSSAYGKQGNPGKKSNTYASLSVVVVSRGSSHESQRAAQALKTASSDLSAQLILVSANSDPVLATNIEGSGAEFVAAPVGSTRAEMCDLGMRRAVGTIVAVRDDIAIGDASWLDAYRKVVPRRVPAPAPMESVVMDTQVPERAPLADVWVAAAVLESSEGSGSIEMAAAI